MMPNKEFKKPSKTNFPGLMKLDANIKNETTQNRTSGKRKIFCHGILLIIFISTLNVKAQNASAVFSRVWAESDMFVKGQLGMKIHCSFTTTGMINKKWSVQIGFVKQQNIYLLAEGGFGSQIFYPQYQSTDYNDLTLFVPYDKFQHLLSYGKQQLKYYASIFCENYILKVSDSYTFEFNNEQQTQQPQKKSYNQTSQNYSQLNTQSSVPPRSEWQNMVYIDKPIVSHYTGQTVKVRINLRNEYQNIHLKVYYKITCSNYKLEVYECEYCEGYMAVFSKTAFFKYRNEEEPTVSITDFHIQVINVVAE